MNPNQAASTFQPLKRVREASEIYANQIVFWVFVDIFNCVTKRPNRFIVQDFMPFTMRGATPLVARLLGYSG